MPTVCILYGFGEGPRVSGRFRKALAAKGYQLTKDSTKADLIITHSGGHLLLPDKARAKQIIHIAPYYWPGRSWLRCMIRKLYDDLHTHHKEGELRFWTRKTFWNFIYALKMPANFRMLARLLSSKPWHHGERTTVVRPRFDSFCTPDPKAMPFKRPPKFISFPGHHDDCWRDPAPYIALIQSKL
jgi:hypothetical protein